MEGALTQARNALRLPLQGYAVQAAAPQGMWPDRWVGTEFSANFTPQRKARGVELELWVPEQLAGDQVLEMEIQGKRWTQHVARGARSSCVLKIGVPAGREFRLSIHAARAFVPAQTGESGDTRELAWKLLGMAIEH
jgi:hypothetical protein